MTSLNVSSYGAVGDGTTDNTSAIASAISACAPGQRLMLNANQTYLVTGITLNKTGMIFDLDGGTLKLRDSSNADLTAITSDGVRVVNGTLDGNGSNQSSAGIGVYSAAADRIVIDDLFVTNTRDTAIRIRNGDDLIVRNCRVTSCVGGINIICSSRDISRFVIENNIVDLSFNSTTNFDAIAVSNLSNGAYNVTGGRISGNRCKMASNPPGTQLCIELWRQANVFFRGCVVASNYVEGGSTGISLADGRGCSVTGNTTRGQSVYGIEFGGTGNTVSANAVESLSGAGIAVNGSGTHYNTVTANTIVGTTDRAIYVDTGAAHNLFSGNFILPTSGQGLDINGADNQCLVGNYAHGGGIRAARSGDLTVTGNRVSGVSDGIALVVNSAVTKDHIAVVGNSITATSNAVGVFLSGGGALGADCVAGWNTGAYGSFRTNMYDLSVGRGISWGGVAPNNNLGRAVGSLYIQLNTGQIWIKETGDASVATGWHLV